MLYLSQGHGRATANPKNTGCDGIIVQGHQVITQHPFTPQANSVQLLACFWEVRENQKTRVKAMQTWEELTVPQSLDPEAVRQQRYPLSSEKWLAPVQLIFGEVSLEGITKPPPIMSSKVQETYRGSWSPSFLGLCKEAVQIKLIQYQLNPEPEVT